MPTSPPTSVLVAPTANGPVHPADGSVHPTGGSALPADARNGPTRSYPTRVRRAGEAAVGHDPALFAALTRGFSETDRLAQDVLDAHGRGEAWALITRALGGDDTGDPAVQALVAPALAPPDWVDFGRVRRGAAVYLRNGGVFPLALGCAALMSSYREGAGVKPLAWTGRLDRHVARRLQETARWVLAVTSPEGMAPGGEGILLTFHVRLLHATVSRHLSASGEWRADEWGAPVNLADSAYAILDFLHGTVHAQQISGFAYRPGELADMAHLWRWIGTLMGVPAALLADDWDRVEQLVALRATIESEPDEDSWRLASALLERGLVENQPVLHRLLGRRVFSLVLAGYTRAWLGGEVADRLHVPPTPLRHIVAVLRPLVYAIEAKRLLTGADDETLAAGTRQMILDNLAELDAPPGPQRHERVGPDRPAS